MNAIAQKDVRQVVNHFAHVMEYIKMPANEEENKQLIAFANELMKVAHRNRKAARLLDLVVNNIELYEKQAYPLEPLSPLEMLVFLMEQHDLTQSDLPEIGTQSHVSKILKGERNLTREQIAALAKRFGVSPAVFYH
jgi:HTH-type transcriptional regulator / antitoxin HigA